MGTGGRSLAEVEQLSRAQRLDVAALSGGVSRMTRGDQRTLSRAEKLLRIRAYSTDPLVLGHVLGPLLVPEQPEYADADAEGAELLRESGADEEYAAAVADELVGRNYGCGLGD